MYSPRTRKPKNYPKKENHSGSLSQGSHGFSQLLYAGAHAIEIICRMVERWMTAIQLEAEVEEKTFDGEEE